MAGPVDTEEQAILNGVLQDPSYAGYATLHIGLSSTTPTEAGANFTEPSGGNYGRVSTVAADWGAASGSAPATKSNTSIKSFNQANADWASGSNMTHWGFFTAASGGTPVWWGPLGTPKPVLNGDTASFGVGALVLKLGDPTDTY